MARKKVEGTVSVNLDLLSPEARAEVEKTLHNERKQEKDRDEAEKLIHKIAESGRRCYAKQVEAVEAHADFVQLCLEGRDKIHNLLGVNKRFAPLGKTFPAKDGVFKTELVVQSQNALDTEKTQMASGLISEVAEEYAKNRKTELYSELLDFLVNMFTQKKQVFQYNAAIHEFLARNWTEPRLKRAQELLRNAVVASPPYGYVRYFQRVTKQSKWVQVPVTFQAKVDVTVEDIERRREAKKKKKKAS